MVTGLSNNNYVEIKSGLKAGDTVYYTEEQTFGNMFGNRGDMGNRPNGDFGGGNMPDMGGEMPDMGGGNMPNFGGGERSDRGNGNRPNGG